MEADSLRNHQQRRTRRRLRPEVAGPYLELLEPRVLMTATPLDTAVALAAMGGQGNASTGSRPEGLLIAPNGDLYGTSPIGGVNGTGTVWRIPAGSTTVQLLASFPSHGGKNRQADGATLPRGGMYLDPQGNLWGAAGAGGIDNKGAIWELQSNTDGTFTLVTVASFTGANGAYPLSGIIADAQGDLFGTATGTIASANINKPGIFEVATGSGSITLLNLPAHSFKSGDVPFGPVTFDGSTTLYGTTEHGGTQQFGSIFKVDITDLSAPTFATVASFNLTDGAIPNDPLTIDANHNVFGVASRGGAKGVGTAFILPASDSSHITALVSFGEGAGNRPIGALLPDPSAVGGFLGVASFGGKQGLGAVFELLPPASGTTWTNTLVASITGGRNGNGPTGPLVMDTGSDRLFGTAFGGGNPTRGIVFEVGTSAELHQNVSQIVFQQPLAGKAAGTALPNVVVRLENAFGQTLTSNADSVTLEIHSGPAGGALLGTVTVNSVNGIATFSGITLDIAGAYTLDVTDGAIIGAPSNPFAITPAAAAQIGFVTQPANASVDVTISPAVIVGVEDQFGNVVPTASGVMTISLQGATASIHGTLSQLIVHGKATFANLTIDAANTYQLGATTTINGATVSAMSALFTIS